MSGFAPKRAAKSGISGMMMDKPIKSTNTIAMMGRMRLKSNLSEGVAASEVVITLKSFGAMIAQKKISCRIKSLNRKDRKGKELKETWRTWRA